MNQKELISHYEMMTEKTISAYGVSSDYTTNVFFLLQAAKMGVPVEKIFDYAAKKCNELHEEALTFTSQQ